MSLRTSPRTGVAIPPIFEQLRPKIEGIYFYPGDCHASDVGHWLAMTGLQELRWAAGHMGPALQKIFVGQGPRALPGGCGAGPVRVVR